jgi:hypothetical protein
MEVAPMRSIEQVTGLSLVEKRKISRALLSSRLNAPRSFPLSHNQEQLWFMDRLQPASPVYNIPLYVPFHGRFDAVALKRALEALTRRHDMLRARFSTHDNQPVQVIEPDVAVTLPIEDLSGLTAEQRSAKMGRLLNDEVQSPFDLTGGSCLRYKLFRLDPANHLLSATFHHIVTDAFSLGIFVRELNESYQAFKDGASAPLLPALQIEYSDYARWQRATLRSIRLAKLVSYWTGKLSGAPQILHLPTDHPRPPDQTFNGTVIGFMLDDDLGEALISASRQHKVTPFVLLLACYYALLYRYTGQEDILVAVPVANRGQPELEGVIGLFVNTLIFRVRLRDTCEFVSLLKDVQQTTLEAFEHQMLPFGKLIDELNVERVPGYAPLYQAVFNFQNASLIDSANPRAEGEAMAKGDFPFVHSDTAKVDLNLSLTQRDATFSGGIEYNTDLFERETIEQMISHFIAITRRILIDPTVQVLDIAMSGESSPNRMERSDDGDRAQQLKEADFNFELNS